jgi:hypothetical protein
MRATSWTVWALVPLFFLTGGARAEQTFLWDELGVFKDVREKEAFKKALALMATFPEKYHRQLVVLTVDSLPPLEHGPIRYSITLHARQNEARQRAEKLGVNGVLLMISKLPPDAIAVAYPSVHRHVFSDGTDATALRNAVRSKLAADPDQALLLAVSKLDSIFRDHYADQLDPSQPTDDLLLAVALAGLVLLLVLVLFMRRKALRTQLPAEQAPARLAGLFAAPAGSWISDKLFVSATPPAPAPVAAAPAPSPPPAAPATPGGPSP